MKIDLSVLGSTELISLMLMSLYRGAGYRRYRMDRFEEYDLYVKNKDFLVSDSVLTFTDTNGRLMALKPDVTLSLIKSIRPKRGELSRLYYSESVYRPSRGDNGFREISQTGVECMGDIDFGTEKEILSLALDSLSLCGERHILEVSHAALLSCFVDALGISDSARHRLMGQIWTKNLHDASALMASSGAGCAASERLLRLLDLCGGPSEVLPRAGELAATADEKKHLAELEQVCCGMDSLQIDLSAVSDSSYYNGIVFRGYVDGIPRRVLSGGRYDVLLQRLGYDASAVGFAVYMDELERIDIPVAALGSAGV